MKIISHRGFWLDLDQKNSKFAFNNSVENNFGTETDIRDLNLKIVVSHDMPSDINLNIDLSQLIDIFLKLNLYHLYRYNCFFFLQQRLLLFHF